MSTAASAAVLKLSITTLGSQVIRLGGELRKRENRRKRETKRVY
jgi:hypothetical protein